MNLEHSVLRSYSGMLRKAGKIRNAIEMITHLEHERRGEHGEYKITYSSWRSSVAANESKVTESLRTIRREEFVTCWPQRMNKNRRHCFGTFQTFSKRLANINLDSQV